MNFQSKCNVFYFVTCPLYANVIGLMDIKDSALCLHEGFKLEHKS